MTHFGVKGAGHDSAHVLPLAITRCSLASRLAQDEGGQDAQIVQVLQDGPSSAHHARMRQHRPALHVFLHSRDTTYLASLLLSHICWV